MNAKGESSQLTYLLAGPRLLCGVLAWVVTRGGLRNAYTALILSVFVGLPTQAFCSARVALVIANSNYQNTPPLRNPSNDGSDVAQALREVGFDVIFSPDADKRAMDKAVVQFSRKALDADAVVFYYAGHGLQYQGRNYLVPTDAELEDQLSVRYELTDLDDIKIALANSKAVKILILDACRNNPLADRFARSFSSGSRDVSATRGLAPIEKTGGMLVVYATQANEIAQDGSGRNSPFTHAFLDQIKTPGLETSVLFRKISSEVYASTSGHQEPEISISHFPDFFLNQSETDSTLWERIRTTADKTQLQAFLTQYPDSLYAPEAKLRIEAIDQATREREEADQRQKLQAEIAHLATENSQRDQIAALEKTREDALASKLATVEAERQHMLDQMNALTNDRTNQESQKREKDAAVVQAKVEAARSNAEQASRDKALQAATDQENALKAEIGRLQTEAAKAKQANDQLAIAKVDQAKLAEAQANATKLSEQLTAAETDRKRASAELLRLQADQAKQQSVDHDHEAKVEAALQAAELARKEKDARDEELRQAEEREKRLEDEIAHLHAATQEAKQIASSEGGEIPVSPTPAQAAPPSTNDATSSPARLTADQLAFVPGIRHELRRIGCYLGKDADWGTPPMNRALLAFSRYSNSQSLSAGPSEELLKNLKARAPQTCPSPCGAGTVEREGVCVVKLIAIPHVETAHKRVRPSTTTAARSPQPRVRSEPSVSSKSCFEFSGQKYCE